MGKTVLGVLYVEDVELDRTETMGRKQEPLQSVFQTERGIIAKSGFKKVCI